MPVRVCMCVLMALYSNVFSLPDYQAGALETYFTEHAPPYTSAQFNNSGSARGFPDIAANGVNITVAVDGEFGVSSSLETTGPLVFLYQSCYDLVQDIGSGLFLDKIFSRDHP